MESGPGSWTSIIHGQWTWKLEYIWPIKFGCRAWPPGPAARGRKRTLFHFLVVSGWTKTHQVGTAGATVRDGDPFKRSTQAHQERVNLKRWVGNVNVATITKVEIHVVDVVHLNERPMQEILPLPMLSDRPSG